MTRIVREIQEPSLDLLSQYCVLTTSMFVDRVHLLSSPASLLVARPQVSHDLPGCCCIIWCECCWWHQGNIILKWQTLSKNYYLTRKKDLGLDLKASFNLQILFNQGQYTLIIYKNLCKIHKYNTFNTKIPINVHHFYLTTTIFISFNSGGSHGFL